MAEMRIKAGVEPRSFYILAAISRIKSSVPITITSGSDGVHMKKSKHYSNEAVDIRSKNFASLTAKRKFISDLQAELGPGYDIILEAQDKPNEHIHIEYDPA